MPQFAPAKKIHAKMSLAKVNIRENESPSGNVFNLFTY